MAEPDAPSACRTPSGDPLVTPRGQADTGGEVLPILELVQPWIDARSVGAIRLDGPSGSGKSVALAHLSAAIGPNGGVTVLDEPEPATLEALAQRTLVIFASARRISFDVLGMIEMARWGDDDAIEYVLAAHHERRASVLRRVLADPDRDGLLEGLPELWRAALDELAADDAVLDVVAALERRLDRLAPAGKRREMAGLQAWRSSFARDARRSKAVPVGSAGALSRLARHRAVRNLLSAEHVVGRLVTKGGRVLAEGLPRELIPAVADRARLEPAAVRALARLVVSGGPLAQPPAASLLHAIDPSWRPPGPPTPYLAGAFLSGALWHGLDLTGASLARADLSGADLSAADLSAASLLRTDLRGSCLSGAKLAGARANEADFRRADLRGAHLDGAHLRDAAFEGANLEGASLVGAQLMGSNLDGANLSRARLAGATLCRARLDATDLSGADLVGAEAPDTVFRTARLVGADFTGANLLRCDFEGVEADAARFRGADLTGAFLSESVLPGADLRGAVLAGAGLAGVEWEGADLRDADFTGASFHMGSTRSGLLSSPIASEGTRTGYYTDESAEQDFKAPEEIRKANLRGADLRGAKVEGTDWYLVDLRETKHTEAQRAHFVRCRAILRNRADPEPPQ